MAGSGKSDYEEWKLFAFPAKRTPPGVIMIVLFLIWALCASPPSHPLLRHAHAYACVITCHNEQLTIFNVAE